MFQSFTPREYLKIDIANSYGLDKLNWDQRISWFDANEHQLDDLLKEAKEPAMFFAGVQAWRQVLAGEPIGYMVSLDSTASGLQLLSILTGDRSAAGLCNVVDTGKREDAYTSIYNMMLEQIGEEAKITRDACKKAIMTSLYSSKAVPKRVFGEGAFLDLFYNTLEALAPAAWELNEAFLTMWNPEAYSHDWVLPDNFHVKIKVMNQVKETVHFLNEPFEVVYNVNEPTPEGRSLGANTIHSIDGLIVREMTRRCDYDPVRISLIRDMLDGVSVGNQLAGTDADDALVVILWDHYKHSGYLSARILDHINADNLIHVEAGVIRALLDSLPEKPFKIIAIHDCFRCLPHYANSLRLQYNLQLMLIAKSDLLQYLISQLLGNPIIIGKLDPTLHNDILEANYSLS